MSFSVFVVTIPKERCRKTYAIPFAEGEDVEEMKNKCWDRIGIHPDDFKLMRGGRVLQNDSVFLPDETLHLHVKVCGGRSFVLTQSNFKGQTKEGTLGKYDPERPWISCDVGLNIKAECTNWSWKDGKPCPVVELSSGRFNAQRGLGAFDLTGKLTCPECKSECDIVTFVFVGDCEFVINGTYQDPQTGDMVTVSRTGDVSGKDAYKTFEPDGEEKKTYEWSSLRVQTCKPTNTSTHT